MITWPGRLTEQRTDTAHTRWDTYPPRAEACIKTVPGAVIITVELPVDECWTDCDASGKAMLALLIARALKEQVDWWEHLAVFWAGKAVEDK